MHVARRWEWLVKWLTCQDIGEPLGKLAIHNATSFHDNHIAHRY
jgi:hypothetical protein